MALFERGFVEQTAKEVMRDISYTITAIYKLWQGHMVFDIS